MNREEIAAVMPQPAWDCANCDTCANRCVQRLASELYDAGAELVQRRCIAECRERARLVTYAAWGLLGMATDPLYRLLASWLPWLPHAGRVSPLLEALLWGGQAAFLFWVAPHYEQLLRNRWSPSRGA